jgi:hypothetical protein
MKKLIALALMAAFAVPTLANAGPVTWSFYETSIDSCNSPNQCVLPPQPFVLMTLTLPGPTSSGTAVWNWVGGPSTPVHTGDSFALVLPLSMGPVILTPGFAGNASNPGGLDCHESISGRAICDFNISWSEAAGDLTSVNINVDAVYDSIGGLFLHPSLGLAAGALASDFTIGGCTNTQCTVDGFWQSDLAVPEPISVVMLLSGLLSAWLASGRLKPSDGACSGPSAARRKHILRLR